MWTWVNFLFEVKIFKALSIVLTGALLIGFLYFYLSRNPVSSEFGNGANGGIGTMVMLFIAFAFLAASTIWLLIQLVIVAVKKKWKDKLSLATVLISFLSVIFQVVILLI